MKLEELIENGVVHGKDSKVTQRGKIDKPKVDGDLEKGDYIPIEHQAVEVQILTSDEFDIPPAWEVEVTVDLEKIEYMEVDIDELYPEVEKHKSE